MKNKVSLLVAGILLFGCASAKVNADAQTRRAPASLDQGITDRLGDATLAMVDVLSEAVASNKQCSYGTSKKEILELISRAYRLKGMGFPGAPATPEQQEFMQKLSQSQSIDKAMSAYLGYRLFANQLDLQQMNLDLNKGYLQGYFASKNRTRVFAARS